MTVRHANHSWHAISCSLLLLASFASSCACQNDNREADPEGLIRYERKKGMISLLASHTLNIRGFPKIPFAKRQSALLKPYSGSFGKTITVAGPPLTSTGSLGRNSSPHGSVDTRTVRRKKQKHVPSLIPTRPHEQSDPKLPNEGGRRPKTIVGMVAAASALLLALLQSVTVASTSEGGGKRSLLRCGSCVLSDTWLSSGGLLEPFGGKGWLPFASA